MASLPQRRPKEEDLEPILSAMSEGKSLAVACRERGLHSSSTGAWLRNDPERCAQYARAKEDRVEYFVEEILVITRAAALGGKTPSGQTVDPAGARVHLDAIKWAAGQMSSKFVPTYRFEHSYANHTEDELDAEIAMLGAKAAGILPEIIGDDSADS